jgi:mannose-6-phosphate isomerase-like protein (cupin superfamily)
MMRLKEIPIIKSDERGIIYDCDKLNFISRKKGTISADHAHNIREILYVVRGNVELTIGKETKQVSAPLRIEIPAHTYHKLVALSNIELLVDRSGK